MSDAEIRPRVIALLAAAVVIVLLLSAGCATAPPRAPLPAQCRPRATRFDLCARKCLEDDAGDPLVWENASDWACFCRKPKAGT